MTHIFQNMFLTFLDRLIEGLNTRFDKYGSVVPKMHAFVPSVIAVEKKIKKIDEIIHEYRDNLLTPTKTFNESQGGKDDRNIFQKKISLILSQNY